MSKVDEVLDTISTMSVLELSELLKEFEDKFGVTAAAPVAAAPAAAAPGDAGDAGGGEEKTTLDVIITAAGENKVKVIKEVRNFSSLGLKEAKDLVEGTPSTLMEGAPAEEANKAKEALEAAGASVELK